ERMNIRAAKTALLCIALVLAAAAGAAAQDSPPAPPDAQPSAQTPPAAAQNTPPAAGTTEWYINKPIKGFSFTGLVTVKESDLQAVLKSYIGQEFSVDPVLMDIQAKLYALDY